MKKERSRDAKQDVICQATEKMAYLVGERRAAMVNDRKDSQLADKNFV
jgi:hypothetical protein